MELNTQLIGNEQRVLARLFSAGAVFEDVGEWIGPYCLLERLGEGGFGTVWRAEQTVPVTREVALKVIKRGMDTRQVLARFDHERQALANMDHPYIAAMLDAGASADGRPYFAMELVTGTTITEWCEKLRSPIHERLRLFILVCHAVNHAHQRGIIHRDLKPSNILVTSMDGVPTPKIIDFGIAKAISASTLEEVSLLTQADQLIGTPLYMSPEQIDGAHMLDTRSDIYALGVLLYELLTGTPPFHSSSTGSSSIEALKRCIREDIPARPSTLIQKRNRLVGHESAIEPSFDHKQPGYSIDLDWIAMRALEKNPAQRYQTSVEFADDIQRFLNNEPILARPPHFAYLASRWIRRNRVVFAASCTVLLALVTATIVSVRQANLAVAARNIAEQQTALAKASETRAASETQRAQQTAAFLTELLDRVSTQIDRGRNPEALKAALVDSEERIKALSDDANLQMQLLKRVADVYSRIGETKQLIPLLKAYAEVSARLNGPTSDAAFIDELNYLKIVIDHGNRSTAPRLLLDLRGRIEAATRAGSKPWLDTQRQLIRTYNKLLQPAQALASADYFINTLQNQKHSKKVLLSTIISCIQAYEVAGDFAKATALLNQCIELNKEVKDEKLAVHIVIQQINLCKNQKEFERGAVILRSEVARLKAKHGEQSPEVFEKIIELVEFERYAQDITNALKHGQEALAIARATPSNRDALANALESIAMTESSARDYATAIKDAQEAYTIAKLTGKASAIHHCIATLAEINSEAGHLEEAAIYYQLQLQRVEAEHANYKERINVMQNIRTIRTKQGRLDEAMKLNEALWTVLSEEPESKNEPNFVADVANQCLSTYSAFKTTKPDEIEPKIVVVWQEASNKAKTSKSEPTVTPSTTK